MMAGECLQVRDYTPADWPAVCRVHDAARLLELSHAGVDARAFRPLTEVADRDAFFTSQKVVGGIDGTVVGFVSWLDSYITWLYTDPQHHRRGYGRSLLRHAMNVIGPEAWTNAIGGNEPAIALYLSAGMEVVWERESECEGYPCRAVRLALPTSQMRDPEAKRFNGSRA